MIDLTVRYDLRDLTWVERSELENASAEELRKIIRQRDAAFRVFCKRSEALRLAVDGTYEVSPHISTRTEEHTDRQQYIMCATIRARNERLAELINNGPPEPQAAKGLLDRA